MDKPKACKVGDYTIIFQHVVACQADADSNYVTILLAGGQEIHITDKPDVEKFLERLEIYANIY